MYYEPAIESYQNRQRTNYDTRHKLRNPPRQKKAEWASKLNVADF